MEEKILNILTELGVPFNVMGRRYLVRAVEIVFENEKLFMTKELYPQIAKEFDSTPARAERAIRHAIESAFYNAATSVITKYFGLGAWYRKGKLTNSEFIYGLAEYLRLHK